MAAIPLPRESETEYPTSEEGKAPCFVLEVTSKTTRQTDLTKKKDLYQRLGVDEYFLFDPLGDYLDPILQGHRLVRGEYRSIPPAAEGSLVSRTLGVIFQPEGSWLRLLDAETQQPLPTYAELRQQARDAEARARALKEELERLRHSLG